MRLAGRRLKSRLATLVFRKEMLSAAIFGTLAFARTSVLGTAGLVLCFGGEAFAGDGRAAMAVACGAMVSAVAALASEGATESAVAELAGGGTAVGDNWCFCRGANAARSLFRLSRRIYQAV